MSCLCVVVDCDARDWGAVLESGGDALCDTVISAVASFVNAHLSLSAGNVVALFAVDVAIPNPLVFTTHSCNTVDITPEVKKGLYEALEVSARNTSPTSQTSFAPSLAVAFCHINRFNKENDEGEGRILIVNLGTDLAREQNACMNIFFAAHKHNVVVDVANIGPSNPVLEQACDITAGTYVTVEKPEFLLQYLMSRVLGDVGARSAFTPSSQSSVDYRASCYCHGHAVSIGWVCSVCLSVQCRFSPFCPVCNTVFKVTGLPRRTKKRTRQPQ